MSAKLKTITGGFNEQWYTRLQQVKPRGVTVHAFVTNSMKAVIRDMLGNKSIAEDAYELEQLRVENDFLKNEIKLLAKKAGVM